MLSTSQRIWGKSNNSNCNSEDPTGYGRIIRARDGAVKNIVEQKDASTEEQLVQEINSGTYCFDNEALFRTLKLVKNENAQGEYYLPDVIEILQKEGEIISAYAAKDFDEILGVNDRIALSQAEQTNANSYCISSYARRSNNH